MAAEISPKRTSTKELPFLEYLTQTSPPGWSYDAPHLRHISLSLEEMESGDLDRLALFMPPRHAKTETVTIRKAAYVLEQADLRGETINVLVTAHTDRLARRFSRKIRDILKNRIEMSRDKSGTDEWETGKGCMLMARGVGSLPTGTGFNWIFIDDPIKSREEADSEVYREKMHDWYEDIYTRLEPDGKIVLTLTRWHHDDVAARAIATAPEEWKVVSFPAEAEGSDELGRVKGDALWPDRYPIDALHRIKSVLTREYGSSTWEALYQQNPTPREGSFFKVSMIKIIEEAPFKVAARCRAWDNAATEDDGNYTAGVYMSGPDEHGKYTIENVIRGRWNFADRNAVQRQTAMLDGPFTTIRGPQDPGAAGKESAGMFIANLAGFHVVTRIVSGKKEQRAEPLATQINAGNVQMVSAPWNAAFLEELRQFPRGKNDDQVDAAADAFSEIAFVQDQEGVVEYYDPVRISRY